MNTKWFVCTACGGNFDEKPYAAIDGLSWCEDCGPDCVDAETEYPIEWNL